MRDAGMIGVLHELLFEDLGGLQVGLVGLVGLRLGGREVERGEDLRLVVVRVARRERLEGFRAACWRVAPGGWPNRRSTRRPLRCSRARAAVFAPIRRALSMAAWARSSHLGDAPLPGERVVIRMAAKPQAVDGAGDPGRECPGRSARPACTEGMQHGDRPFEGRLDGGCARGGEETVPSVPPQRSSAWTRAARDGAASRKVAEIAKARRLALMWRISLRRTVETRPGGASGTSARNDACRQTWPRTRHCDEVTHALMDIFPGASQGARGRLLVAYAMWSTAALSRTDVAFIRSNGLFL